jgi:uncharacterized protein (DUF983 family)
MTTWSTDEDDDWSDEEGDDLIPCPYCGEDLYDDAPQCPACGKYLSEEDRPPEKKPPWVLIGIVICLVVALAWAAGM